MMKGSTIEKMSRRAATRLIKDFVGQLNSLLKLDPFLAGAQPGYLDLCCYHPLWMASVINRESIPALPPLVQAWIRGGEAIALLGYRLAMYVATPPVIARSTG